MTTATTTGPKWATGTDHYDSVNPADYEVIGYYYTGSGVDMQFVYGYSHAQLDKALLARFGSTDLIELTGAKSGSHCQSCGAFFNHGAVAVYLPENRPLIIGQICGANTFGLPSISAKMQKKAEKRRVLREAQEAGVAFAMQRPELVEALFCAQVANTLTLRSGSGQRPRWINGFQFDVLTDMAQKLFKWGSLSDKQVAFAIRLGREVMEQAQPKDEPEQQTLVPVVEGNGITIEGTVVSTRWEQFWEKYNMLIEDDRGFRVWGTVPSAMYVLDVAHCKGARVRFVANVTKSDKDESFGFFKRPRKLGILADNPGA